MRVASFLIATAIITAGVKRTADKRRAANEQAIKAQKIASQSNTASRKSTASSATAYEKDLFLAKVAMLSYIANADGNISREEEAELEEMYSIAYDLYGSSVEHKAEDILESSGNSFMSYEPYFQKVHTEDLEAFIFYAEEFAETDNEISQQETDAIQKIRSYVESRKGSKAKETVPRKTAFTDLTCPKCGGTMHPDTKGYKAECPFCGNAIVMDTENASAGTHKAKAGNRTSCPNCGETLTGFSNSAGFIFCPYCGYENKKRRRNTVPKYNYSLSISYESTNPRVVMVTRIVSTGQKDVYVNGDTKTFDLPEGSQTIVLKIGKINYNRDIVITGKNNPKLIRASFDGRAHIEIE